MSAKEVSPRLGRGLAALMGESAPPAAAAAGSAVRAMPIDLLAPGPFQPRGPMDEASLAELASSIRRRGVLQPLLARPHPEAPGRWQIIAGERRWRAAQIAGLHEVPTLVRDLADADAMAAALVENLQRQDLNAIEEAEGYRRLIEEFEVTQETLGEAVGKSRSHVSNTLRLLNLPKTVQAEVRNGALSAGHARALLGHPEPEHAARAVIARGLNVRQTEALVGRAGIAAEASKRAEGGEPDTAALARDLSQRLGLKVEIDGHGRRGVLRVHYSTLEQLDGVVSLLRRN